MMLKRLKLLLSVGALALTLPSLSVAQSSSTGANRVVIEGAVFEPKTVLLLEQIQAPQIQTPQSPPASAIATPPTFNPEPVALPSAVPATSAPLSFTGNPAQLGQTSVAIDTNNLWDRIRSGFAMPNLDTNLAADRTQWYAKQPEYVTRMTARGGQYLFHIVEELEKRKMPTELALLPFIESAFNPQAVSSAKAAGMWQFMPATGKDYKLKQNLWRDERRGVIESTRAALDYLQKLNGMFGDWHLALAAYNWGEGSVQRAINKNRAQGLPTDYVSLNMPTETQYYVPKFQAMKNIIQSPEQYGLRLSPLPNEPFFRTIVKERDIDVDLAAKFAGMSLTEFRALNPSFKKPVILGANKPEILLPSAKVAAFNTALDSHKGALSSWTTASVRGTEKPSVFAKRYGMSEAVLRSVNNIPPRMLITPGSTLVVSKVNAEVQTANIPANLDNATISFTPEMVRRVHTARKGDTLAKIAKRYGLSVGSLQGWNRGLTVKRGTPVVFYVPFGSKKGNAVARSSSKRAVTKRKRG